MKLTILVYVVSGVISQPLLSPGSAFAKPAARPLGYLPRAPHGALRHTYTYANALPERGAEAEQYNLDRRAVGTLLGAGALGMTFGYPQQSQALFGFGEEEAPAPAPPPPANEPINLPKNKQVRDISGLAPTTPSRKIGKSSNPNNPVGFSFPTKYPPVKRRDYKKSPYNQLSPNLAKKEDLALDEAPVSGIPIVWLCSLAAASVGVLVLFFVHFRTRATPIAPPLLG